MSVLLRVLYGLASVGLAVGGTISAVNKAPLHAVGFALAALLFLTAVYRETECVEEHHPTPQQAAHDPVDTQVQAWFHAITELDRACCETWWTSLATDHDPTCPHQTRKEPR